MTLEMNGVRSLADLPTAKARIGGGGLAPGINSPIEIQTGQIARIESNAQAETTTTAISEEQGSEKTGVTFSWLEPVMPSESFVPPERSQSQAAKQLSAYALKEEKPEPSEINITVK